MFADDLSANAFDVYYLKTTKRQTGDQFCKNNERAKQINRGHSNGSRVVLL